MSNLVPDSWRIDNLDSMTKSITVGHVGSTSKFYRNKGVLFLRTGNLNSGKIVFDNAKYITREFHESLKKSQLCEGDVLVSRVGYTGNAAIVPPGFPESNCANIIIIRANRNIDPKYLHLYINSPIGAQQNFSFTVGSAQAVLNIGSIKKLKIIIPTYPEQQKIAAILSSVDDVIEKTQAQIDKLKDLKTGMMQELLSPTEGKCVGDDNKPCTKFKDSPIGRIPFSWDCVLLDTVASRGSGHTPDKKQPTYWNGGIKWVSLTDSSNLDKLYINDTKKKISSLGIENSSANLHPKGTVVMTRDAGIGKSAIITEEMAVSQHFMAWFCGDRLNNYFLYYLLQLWKPKFEAIAMGSTIKTIGLPFFKKLYIPVPPIKEQLILASSIRSVDDKIFSLEKKNQSNSNIKKGLMQDLLTGKVRVQVDESNKEVV